MNHEQVKELNVPINHKQVKELDVHAKAIVKQVLGNLVPDVTILSKQYWPWFDQMISERTTPEQLQQLRADSVLEKRVFWALTVILTAIGNANFRIFSREGRTDFLDLLLSRRIIKRGRAQPIKAAQQWYRPLEVPTRYPLELVQENDCYHVCLWFADGKLKYTIALIYPDKEGDFDVRFVGDRPLQERVNWEHFRELLIQGIALARQSQKEVS